MDRTTEHQTFMTLTRCASELRGIAKRMDEAGERLTAEQLERIAQGLMDEWPTLRGDKHE